MRPLFHVLDCHNVNVEKGLHLCRKRLSDTLKGNQTFIDALASLKGASSTIIIGVCVDKRETYVTTGASAPQFARDVVKINIGQNGDDNSTLFNSRLS